MNLTDIFSNTNISTTASVASTLAAISVAYSTIKYVGETTKLRKQNDELAALQQLQLEEQRKQLSVQQEQLALQQTSYLEMVLTDNPSKVSLLNLSDGFVHILDIRLNGGERLNFLTGQSLGSSPTVLLQAGEFKMLDPNSLGGRDAQNMLYEIRYLYGKTPGKIHTVELRVSQ